MQLEHAFWPEFRKLKASYTTLFGELEHLKIKTRLINEMFTSVIVGVMKD